MRMPIVTAVLALLLVCSISPSVYGQEPAPTKHPRLVISEPVFNFGTVRQGAKVEHQFELANRGDAPLQISKVHPSCGCTAVMVGTDTLKPGETTFIKTTFDTNGFQGDKTKTVRIYTNDPQQTSAVLTIKGNVEAEIRLEPDSVQLGNVLQGKRHRGEVSVLVEKDSGVKLLELESRSPELEATWEDLPGNAGKKVTVALKESAPLGAIRSRVVVKTNSEKLPVINIPVLAFVEGDVQMNPNTVSFGLLDGPLQNPETRTVVITNRGSENVTIESVRSDNENVSADLAVLEQGKRYAVKVTLKQNAGGAIRTRITITTDHPKKEEQELILPVYAIISRGNE